MSILGCLRHARIQRGGGRQGAFAKRTFISNKPFFEYLVGTSSHPERGWSGGGSNSANFLVSEGRENPNTT